MPGQYKQRDATTASQTAILAPAEATVIETARPITAAHAETLSTQDAHIVNDAKRRTLADKRARLASAILGPRVARRLVAAHAIGIVAGGWVTVALADSLFFKLTVDASRPQVLRYLAITIVPAAGLTRLIGPAVDRSRGGPGRIARHSNGAHCVCAVGLAVSLDTSAFFAWALLLLVANKLFTTSRYAMLPMLIQDRERLVAANVRLSKWGGVAGGFGVATGLVLSHSLGTRALLVAAAAGFYVAACCRPIDVERHQPVDGEGSARRVASRRLRTASISLVTVRGAVGLLTFTCAFAFRGGSAPPVIFAAIGISYAVGSFIGNAAAPAARQRTSEDRMIVGSLLATLLACSIAAVVPAYGPFVAASFFVARRRHTCARRSTASCSPRARTRHAAGCTQRSRFGPISAG